MSAPRFSKAIPSGSPASPASPASATLAALALSSLLATTAFAGGCTKEGTTNSNPAPAAVSDAVLPSAAQATAAAVGAGSTPTELAVGKPAPEFSVKASDGASFGTSSLKGKPVVVYFYPKDETPGCTKEACSFRDAWNDLAKTNVVLLGVSGDSDESHKAFSEHHKLPFHLVSDADGALAKKFGVPTFGRQSFVIGIDGNVKKIYRSVNVQAHAQEILADLK
jgi:thioredoxin-dependent peroxiredoxin